ncbi:MAG TPA: cobalamin-dependent protein [Solirubrobacteraceae bacterium]|nr:cobalamin-dependent protein [Solirubrobacteraceae bacterium]
MVRVLLTKPTHDCHDRGVRYLAKRFRDEGFEVVFTNFLLPGEILATAAQEDVDAIGISSSSGGHMAVFEEVMRGLAAHGLDEVTVIAGGSIPPADAEQLRAWGVLEVFGPGSNPDDAIELVKRQTGGGSTRSASPISR